MIKWVLAALLAAMIYLAAKPDLPIELTGLYSHAAGFAVLGFVMRKAFAATPVWVLFVGLVIFGAATEILQIVMDQGRSGELTDWLIDCAAAAAGIVLAITHSAIWRWLIRHPITAANEE